MRNAIALAGLLLVMACGSDPPTSVGTPDPPGLPPPDVEVDWDALADVLADPLYRRLPNLLLDQQSAQPLKDAVIALASALALENLDLVRQELAVIALERAAYRARAGYDARDLPLLTAMALLEMRAVALVPAAGQSPAGQAEVTILPETEGGDR